MNPDNQGQNNSSTEWIPLSEAAQFTPYSADYLSLLARKGRLTAKKNDGIWYTTKAILNNYLIQQAKRAEALNQNTGNYLPFISESVPSVPAEIKPEAPAVVAASVVESASVMAGNDDVAPASTSVPVAAPSPIVEVPKYSAPRVKESESLTDKSVSGDALMEEFMRRFNAQIDRQVDSQHGFLFKLGRFIRRSYGYTLRSPKRLPLFIACLLLVVILPFRFVSGFADNLLAETMYAVKNAQTVMGFRPGTHENEILLLGPEGEIAIFGNVETEGQFRSYVEDGIAPITVKSTTKVENLNADMLDGVSGHEFTLAYVTKNGNVTYEPVFLEGTVEVGETLLVKGATKLLSSLRVDGNLSVFGEANFAKGISVSGPAVFKDILTAPSVIVSDLLRAHKLIVEEESIFESLVTIKDDLDVEGSVTASSGRISGTFRVQDSFHADADVSLGSDGYVVRVTSEDWSVDNDGNADFADITGDDASFSSLSVGGNLSAGSFSATDVSATSTFAGTLSLSGALADAGGSVGTSGYVLQSTGTSTAWVATSTLGFTGGGGSGITTLNSQTGVTQSFATGTATGIGLTITSSGDVHTFTPTVSSGYSIPLTASSTNWNTFYDTPSSRIAAGTNLAWSGNTLNGTFGTSSARASISETITGIDYDNSTGVFALTSGYVIPLTASTTEWSTAYASTTAMTPSYIRGLFSNAATGLTYDSGTGATSLTAGYVIPLTASTTEWSTAFGWGNHSLAGYLTSTSIDTSAELATILTDETGTGSVVFSVAPTFTGNTTLANASTTNLTVSGNSYLGTILGGTWNGTDVDISDYTNLGVTATGLELSGDNIALTSGYTIPLTASTTEWSTAFSWGDHSLAGYLTDITAQSLEDLSDVAAMTQATGDLLYWTGAAWSNIATSSLGFVDTNTTYTAGDHLTLTGTDFDVDDDFLLNTGDTGVGNYSFSGGTFSVAGTSTLATTTATALSATTLSLTNALSVANGGTGATSLTGLLLGNGTSAFTATTTLAQGYGGTGINSYTAGDILYADGSGVLSRLPVGSAGQVLKVAAGLPSWGLDLTSGGGGGGDGVWATSTTFIYPADPSNTVLVGNNATTTTNSIFEVTGNSYFSGNVGIGDTTPAARLTVGAGDAFQVTSAGTVASGTWNGTDIDISDYTNLGVTATGLSLSGDNIALTAGYTIPLTASTTEWSTAYASTTAMTPSYIRGLFSGTSPITYNSSSGAFGFDFSTNNTWTGTNTFSATTTLATTSIARLSLTGGFIDSTGSIGSSNNILLSSGTSTRWVATSTLGFLSSAITSLNGQTGATQTFATGTATGIGLTITSAGDIHTFTPTVSSGYSIPLTASSTNWNTFYDTPSTRIAAGDALTWSGNTLNFDGGDTPGGELGGTWASPTIDAEIIALEELSDVDTFTQAAGDVLYWNGTGWNVTATSTWDTNTTYTAGDHLTLTGTDFDVDDDFLLNTGDTGVGNYSFSGGTFSVAGTSTLATTTATALSATTLSLTNALSVANGGTGATSLTGLLLGNGTSAFTATTTLSSSYLESAVILSSEIDTSAELAAILTDETGTAGSVVFSASPTFTGNTTLANASTTNLTVSGNSYLGTVLSGTWNGTDIDISDYTNLGVTATGLSLSGDNIALTAGYTIPLTASTTNWNTFYDTPSTRITAGDGIDWTGNTLNVLTDLGFFTCTDCLNETEIEDIYVLNAGDSMTGNLTMSGTAANVILGSNYLSGDGGDEGVFVDGTGNVGIGTSSPSNNLHIANAADAAIFLQADTDNATESDNPFVKLTQDGGAVQAIFGLVGDAGRDPEHVAYTNTLGNSILIGGQTSLEAIHLGTNDTVRLTVDTSGNVGIGTTTPSQMLSVGATTGSQFLVTSAGAVTDGSWTADVIADDYGGTGQSTYSTGDMLYASGANTLAKRTIGSTGNVLSVVGGVPTWSATSTLGFITASDFDTCAEFAAIMTGETGTCGSVVLSASPTFTGTITAAAATLSSTLTMSGTAANIALGSNYLSGDGGDEGIFVDSSGNVGIGTTTPEGILHISTNQNSSQSAIFENINTGTSSQTTLQVRNGTDINSALRLGAIGENFTTLGSYRQDSGVVAAEANLSGGLSLIARNASGVITFTTGGYTDERMRIDSAGNVGIGTSTPTSLLNIESTSPVLTVNRAGTGTGNAYVAFNQNGTGKSFIGIAGTTDGLTTGSVAGDTVVQAVNQKVLISTDAGVSAAVTVATSGNVGIGTTTPAGSLHISSDLNAGASAYSGQLILSGSNNNIGLNINNSQSGGRNWGIYSSGGSASVPSSFRIYDHTGGDRMVINSSGNVGIGTTTPAAKLNVLSTTEQLRLSYSSSVYWSDVIASDGGRTLTGFGSDGDLDIIFTGATDGDFSINGDDLFVDTSAGGFVGVNTSAPATQFHVDGTVTVGANTASLQFLADQDVSALNPGTTATAAAIIDGPTNSHIIFDLKNNDANDAIAFRYSAANTATVDTIGLVMKGNGDVGIGTSSPATKLHLYDGATDTPVVMTFQNDARRWSIGVNGSDLFRVSDNTAGVDRMTIDTSGDVGIGTTTPDQRLSVVGASGTSVAKFDLVNATADTVLELSSDDGFIASGSNFLSWSDGGTTLGVIRGDGNLGIGTTTPGSDLTVAGTANITGATTLGSTLAVTGAITEAGSAVLSAANIDTCAEFIALVSSTGTCGSAVFSVSPTLTGTTQTATINMDSGVLYQTQSATFNVYIQGSAPGTAAGDARNIALIGNEAADDLILNYNSEYDCVSVGGTACTEALTVTGAISSTGSITEAGSNVLSVGDLDTCAEFAALGAIETGTCGSLVLSVSPTLTGTLTAAAANFSGAVDIDGDLDGNAQTIARTTDEWLRINPDAEFTSGIYLTTGITRTDGTLQVGASGATLSVASGGDFLFDTSLLALDNSADSVGVGTAAPSAQLEVYGVPQLTAALTDAGVTTGMLALNGNSSSAGSGGALTFGNNQSVAAGSVGYAAIKGLLTNGGNNTTGDLAFATRNAATDTALTERMRILAAGNVGIGDSSPAALFTVGNGDLFQVNSSGAIAQGTGVTLSDGANRTITIETEGVGTAGRALILKGGNGGSGGGAGGNIIIGGGSPGGVGDIGYTILGHNGSGTGNVGIQDTVPTEAMLVVGAAGAGDIYSTLATAGTTNNAVCWDNAGATLLYDCDATPADYAESYPVDEGVTYGDIVMTSNDTVTQTDGQTVSKLIKAEKGSEHAVIGIVSNNYHDFTSAGSESIDPEDNPMPVALSGRVPVKVNLEGGEIEVGDSVILSSEPGVATKATSTGERIGIALESYESGDDTILVFVDNGMYYAPDFLAFITKGEAELSESGDTIFDRLVTLAESFVDGVLKLASAEIEYVKADKVETNELCVGSVCVDENTFLQMVESSGGAVHAMEHEPEPEPEEETAASTDSGAEEGDTGAEDTVTDDTEADPETEIVDEETPPTEEPEVVIEEETPAEDTEEVVVDTPAPESAG